MADQPFAPMQIGQILDKTTVVIIGPGVDKLTVNDELQILAVGREIPNVGVPLVVPKAHVRVYSVAGAYVVARTGTYEVEVSAGDFTTFSRTFMQPRKETRRYELAVDEKQMVGNPSNTPVAVGDPVIKPGDLPRFLESLGRPGHITTMGALLKGPN
jgi:hypothetical protein